MATVELKIAETAYSCARPLLGCGHLQPLRLDVGGETAASDWLLPPPGSSQSASSLSEVLKMLLKG